MRLNLELTKTQIEILIGLTDQLIDSINDGGKDPFKMGIDEYINLAHDLEASLDDMYSPGLSMNGDNL